jgi:hypothetical protein
MSSGSISVPGPVIGGTIAAITFTYLLIDHLVQTRRVKPAIEKVFSGDPRWGLTAALKQQEP